MKYKLFLFPVLFAIIAGMLAISYSEEIFILFSIPAFFFATIALTVYVATLTRMYVVEEGIKPNLTIKRILILFSTAAFIFFATSGFVYTFHTFALSGLMSFVAIAGLALSTALVWRPVINLHNHVIALVLLFLTIAVLAGIGINAGHKFNVQRDMLYSQKDEFKTVTDCEVFTFLNLKAECLKYYSENTHGGITVCPSKIDATSMQCYAVKAIREQNFQICENKDFIKFYKKYPYEGWLGGLQSQYGLQDEVLACQIKLATDSVGEVDKEYYRDMPRGLVATILPKQITTACKNILLQGPCETVVSAQLSSKFYLNEKVKVYTIDVEKNIGNWQVKYPSKLNQVGDSKSFYEQQLVKYGPSSSEYIARYNKVRSNILEHFTANEAGNSKINLVVTNSDSADVLAFIMNSGYGIDTKLEKVTNIPILTKSNKQVVVQVYKYRTKPNYYAVVYKLTQGVNYLFLTSEDKELGYEIARSITQ